MISSSIESPVFQALFERQMPVGVAPGGLPISRNQRSRGLIKTFPGFSGAKPRAVACVGLRACALRTCRTAPPRQLGRRGIRRPAEQNGFSIFRDLAHDLAELAHPERAEWEHDVCQTGDVGAKGVAVFLDETTVA